MTAEQQALTALAQQVKHVFVTGAGGFLGKAVCRLLLAADIKVTGFARGSYPELEQLGVTMIQGSIADFPAVLAAMQECDLVFHLASKAGVWGSKTDYYQTNVLGSVNIIKACQQLAIRSLVYTSSPSVTFSGQDENAINETQPYAKRHLNHYSASKAVAEQLILEANKHNNLATVALRPHLIWGPDDPHIVPRVIAKARAGRLKLVGAIDKLVDTTYVDNAAYAHILAALTLTTQPKRCAGKSYFISNDQPITMADMLNKIIACVDLPVVTKRVPSPIAYGVGALLEACYLLLNKKQEPMMTRFVARQLATSHYFDINAAKKDLGYLPLVSIEEGMQRLQASLS